MIARKLSDTESAAQAWELMRRSFSRRLSTIAFEVSAATQSTSDQRKSLRKSRVPKDILQGIAADEIGRIDLLAQKYFNACSDIWTNVLTRPKSKAFYNAVFIHCLLSMFEQQDDAIRRRLRKQKQYAEEQHFASLMLSLRWKWRKDLKSQAYDALLKRRSERARTIRAEVVAQQHQTAHKAQPHNSGKSRGRKRRLEPEFVKVVGRLWRAELQKVRPGKVKEEGLLRTAAQLDALGFRNPANYLEGDAGTQLKLYSKKSNSPIETWRDLALSPKAQWTDPKTNKKKSFRYAMRRLFSRCARTAGI